jgi:hypothetical protein
MENEQNWQGAILDSKLGERIAAIVEIEVTKSLKALDIEAEVAKSLEELDIEAMVHAEIEKALGKIEHKVVRARERAQRAREKAHRAAEKMARHQEKMRLAAEKMARRQENATLAASPHQVLMDAKVHSKDAQPQVSEEEQLSILRMLQEGTITTEQADMLLNALAG